MAFLLPVSILKLSDGTFRLSLSKPQMDTDKHRLDKTTEHTEYTEKEKSNSVFSVYSVVKNIALSVAPKLFIQAEHGAFVAERFYTTGWIKIEIENGEFR